MKKKKNNIEPHYDFSRGVRGKYAKAFRKGITITVYSPDKKTVELEQSLKKKMVSLEPDIASVFPNDEAVNRALRHLIAALPKVA